jgi:hypothetical protein
LHRSEFPYLFLSRVTFFARILFFFYFLIILCFLITVIRVLFPSLSAHFLSPLFVCLLSSLLFVRGDM